MPIDNTDGGGADSGGDSGGDEGGGDEGGGDEGGGGHSGGDEGGDEGGGDEGGTDPVDADGDGVTEEDDCDDTDASVYPGAPERCDGKDNDCDAAVDGLNVPSDHADLDAAYAAAAEGELICLEPGTYAVSGLAVDKGVHIAGYGSEQTVLQAGGADPTLSFSGTTGFELSGLSIEDAEATGGVLTFAGAQGRLEDVVVRRHTSLDTASTVYGALYTSAGTTLELVDVWIEDSELVQRTSYNRLNGGATWFEESDITWTGGGVSGLSISQSTDSGTASADLVLGAVAAYLSTLTFSEVVLEDIAIDVDAPGGNASVYGFLYLSSVHASFTDVVARDISIQAVSTGSTARNASATGILQGGTDSGQLVWHGGGIEGLEVHAESLGPAYVYGLQATSMDWQDLELHDLSISNLSTGSSGRCEGIYSTDGDAIDVLRRVDIRDVHLACEADRGSTSNGLLMSYADSGSTTWENLVVAGSSVTGVDQLKGGLGSTGPLSLQNLTVHDLTVSGEAVGALLWSQDTLAVDSSSLTSNTVLGTSVDADFPAVFVQAEALDWSYTNAGFNSVSGSSETLVGSDTPSLSSQPGAQATSAGFVDDSSASPLDWDLSLASGSSLIDAGNPDVQDLDGSTADMGAWGGPEAFE